MTLTLLPAVDISDGKAVRLHRGEAEGIEKYDYIVINDNLEECVRKVHGIIMAARSTPDRNGSFIADIRSELDVLVGMKQEG